MMELRLISFRQFKKYCGSEYDGECMSVDNEPKCSAKICPVWKKLTTFTSKEEISSTVMEVVTDKYITATSVPKDTTFVASTSGSITAVRSVSTSIITGEVKLRLAPREMPNRKLNISSC
jgi:hypothetical protein